jgi:hypothetical protein
MAVHGVWAPDVMTNRETVPALALDVWRILNRLKPNVVIFIPINQAEEIPDAER